MSEENFYKDGDIVWVKLGYSWWPGEVIVDKERLPDEVYQLKKRPFCVVKFFQEDAYEYPKTAKQVYPFQSSKKNEFIKKGLALYNAKKKFMEKFPDDVKHAENLTKPTITTKIINDGFAGFGKDTWGNGLTQKSTDYDGTNQFEAGVDSQNQHGTTRRDSMTTILNITATPPSTSATAMRTLSTSSSASITPNAVASSQYRCNLCEFTTMRQNVLIMHRKSHSSAGKGPTPKALAVSTVSTQSRSQQVGELAKESHKEKNLEKISVTRTSSPLISKGKKKTPTIEAEMNVDASSGDLNVSSRSTRKRVSATPSPKLSNSKNTMRNLRAAQAQATTDSRAPEKEDTKDNEPEHSGSLLPTDRKNSEQIRQRLLADWSDEDKEENQSITLPSTSRQSKSPNKLQIPAATKPAIDTTLSIKRRSPTIVSMKTLEGAGQTLVVAAAAASQEVNDKKLSTTRIRNIPKKDRLRDFDTIIPTTVGDEQQEETSELSKERKITNEKEKNIKVKVSPTAKSQPESMTLSSSSSSCAANVSKTTLSCFDFQEDEEEPENDVLKSIADYKKKYFSPDKDRSMAQSTTTSTTTTTTTSTTMTTNNETASNKKVNSIEQRDKELSAEIDSLLEKTAQSLREDIMTAVSVKGLPIKERGKRIFKSRNRTQHIDVEDDSGRTTTTEAAKVSIESIEANTEAKVLVDEEIKQDPLSTPSLSERKTRGTSGKRLRGGKLELKEQKTTTSSPVNGNSEKIKTKEDKTNESSSLNKSEPVQSVAEMIYVSQRSKRKPYNHRIMRQLIEEEETSIPFIRHSPVEIFSVDCNSLMDNGNYVVRGRRSKATTPNPLTTIVREDNVNGGNSRTPSRNLNAAPLTPTDETSSLGVSDAGAEFGSPTSSLDEERVLTPEFKPINEQPTEKCNNKIDDDDNADDEEALKNDVEEDDEIESPPHEALSGNELEDNEIKGNTKRLKSPKKKLNSKEEQKDTTSREMKNMAPTRNSGTKTQHPDVGDVEGDNIPKRLTRNAVQQQGKESPKQIQKKERIGTPVRRRSVRESPTNVDAKQQKQTQNRSTPTRTSSNSSHTAAVETELTASHTPPIEEKQTINENTARGDTYVATDDLKIASKQTLQTPTIEFESKDETTINVGNKESQNPDELNIPNDGSEHNEMQQKESSVASEKLSVSVSEKVVDPQFSPKTTEFFTSNTAEKESIDVGGKNLLSTPVKKPTRWDSPHRSSDKKNLSPDLLHSADKKQILQTEFSSDSDKKSPRCDAVNISESKLPRTNSPHSSQTKKLSRWDSPTLVERKKKIEDTKLALNVLDAVVKTTSCNSTIVEDSKETIENLKEQQATTNSTTSPTMMEKVRINVDVANPLSTQIANILAASGSGSSNTIHNQQQPLRNKSPKSSLKRKHSLEESNVVVGGGSSNSASDGDAVVAHMQSLCPQVKITRKERIIEPEMVDSSLLFAKNSASHYDINQMPILISNEQISAPPIKSPRASGNVSISNLWQTDLLQPAPSTTMSPTTAVTTTKTNTTTGRSLLSLVSRSSQSPGAASSCGRKQAGNTVSLPSSITVQQQHKFAEALTLADKVIGPSTKPTKRRNSQTTATTTSAYVNRRLSSAPALDIRSSPPAKKSKIATGVEQISEGTAMEKPWLQSQSPRLTQQIQKKTEIPYEEVLDPIASTSCTKITNTEDSQNSTDVEQINSTAKITAVPIQPIPGYAETFLLCMLVENMYKPINNIPHYLNTDLNQLVPVPPEAYEGMLPELAVDQPPAVSADNDKNQTNNLQHQTQQCSPSDKRLLHTLLGDSNVCSDNSNNTADENGLKLVLQSGDASFTDSTALSVDSDATDGTMTENVADNAIVLNLENQQIILDAATFEQLLANPDANTQLVTDDGTEFVLTREVLTALKAQHDGQNVELLAISAEQQQLHEQLIVAGGSGGGIGEAGSSSGELLTVALAGSEFYANDVLQIETTLGGVTGTGAAGLQLLASDGSIVFQAPPLPQAHLTPPITAHTSETNAVLNQTPIMSTLEKPSTAIGAKVESPTNATIVSAVESNITGMRPNLEDSLAVIGVSTQSSTVPTSLELPITITNPAIAPKVTMAAQSALTADLVQFQPHRSVAATTATAAATAAVAALTHIYDDAIDGIN